MCIHYTWLHFYIHVIMSTMCLFWPFHFDHIFLQIILQGNTLHALSIKSSAVGVLEVVVIEVCIVEICLLRKLLPIFLISSLIVNSSTERNYSK